VLIGVVITKVYHHVSKNKRVNDYNKLLNELLRYEEGYENHKLQTHIEWIYSDLCFQNTFNKSKGRRDNYIRSHQFNDYYMFLRCCNDKSKTWSGYTEEDFDVLKTIALAGIQALNGY
jgi:hypothetical protein